MECSGHAPETFGRVNEHRLWCLERLPRLQPPGEIKRIDAQRDARRSELIDLGFRHKISAINQAESVYLALALVRFWTEQR
ncbi:hypothetical protein D3C77_334350 [compost metagenome]